MSGKNAQLTNQVLEPVEGLLVWPSYYDHEQQKLLLEDIRQAVKKAPLFVPKMPRTGKPMSVRMSNMGPLGWVCDKDGGYRYQAHHPVTGTKWPDLPDQLSTLWEKLSAYPHKPEACLINYYSESAKMGLHQDRDEDDFDAPVLSVSLGDECLFRVGGHERGGKTQSFRLKSGDVMMLSGDARLRFHGVDRLYPGTSALLGQGGRLNLTLRRVTKPVS